ncbi:unnamed protein product [marine sediment metagenome]|jgi:deazaflavin-dependent oxidoreductase (nitroreductase family)|uniref:Nitroreductase n=1 Tax=marine sediment metagenome TaxID=412755 RepID=X1EVH6_9ZZZZ
MVEKISDPKPPRGIALALYRAPIWLYKINLGFLLGKRFLMLTHTGRKSGLHHRTVVEVVKHEPDNNTYFIASGWGENSDWVKNITVGPQVQVQVGNKHWDMIAERLIPNQAEEVIFDYAQRHPSAMMNLARMMGYKLDGSEQDFRELGRQLPLFALKPKT